MGGWPRDFRASRAEVNRASSGCPFFSFLSQCLPFDVAISLSMHTESRTVLRRFLHYWFLRETVRRALKIACIVGPVLTVINQHDVLLRGEFSLRLALKILLTFAVPYSVSSFSSARAYMERENTSPR